NVTKAMGINVAFNIEKKDDKKILIDITGDSLGVLIGKRGQTLDALQYLTSLAVNRGDGFVSITLDTEDYRKRRRETLENLAKNIAGKVKTTKKRVILEPMSAYERRIIHYALQNDKFVITHSEGLEPFRNVVISPKKDKPSAPEKPERDKKYQSKNSGAKQPPKDGGHTSRYGSHKSKSEKEVQV
ncbi:MAG: KH domain-containing protein, partial [Clostridiales bacterium]|nr:KH domain-containing protein [Clostridiales bacterium]